MELKTLNEILKDEIDCLSAPQLLRQNAIKRAKYYLEELNGYIELMEIGIDSKCEWRRKLLMNFSIGIIVGKVEELVEFYSITMEELEC